MKVLIEIAPIEFNLPPEWRLDEEPAPFVLGGVSKDGQMFTGVIVFQKGDLASGTIPTDILNQQIKNLESKRTNFAVLEALARSDKGNSTHTTVTYHGENGSAKHCYRFTLIEFKSDKTKFLVVIQTSAVEEWANARRVLEEITDSAKALYEVPIAQKAGKRSNKKLLFFCALAVALINWFAVKSVVKSIELEGAYGYMKIEAGNIQMSNSKRRAATFCSCFLSQPLT